MEAFRSRPATVGWDSSVIVISWDAGVRGTSSLLMWKRRAGRRALKSLRGDTFVKDAVTSSRETRRRCTVVEIGEVD